MSTPPASPRENGFLQGPILQPLIRFALPLMLSLFLQALYGGIDLAVVGHYSTTAAAAAVSTGSQVMQSFTVVVTGLTMGVTVLIGKAMGAKDHPAAGAVVAAQIRLFTLVAVLLTAIGIACAPQLAAVMNVPPEAVGEAVDYIRICAGGMVFITAYNAISGVFRGLGNSRSPLLFVFIACLVNIVLDLLFVGGFGMAAAGAALATVLAQASSVLFSLLYIRRNPLPFAVTSYSFHGPGQIRRILRVGSPIALQDLLVNISFLMITSVVNHLGVVEAAGIGVSEKLFIFLSIVPMAFMSALSTFVAQNLGAGQPGRARASLWIAQRISFAIGTVIFLMAFLAGDLLSAVFAKDELVIAAAAEYLRGSSFEYLMIPLTFCFLGYFNGMERTAFVMLQGLLSAFLVRVPLTYLFSSLPGAGMFTISLAVPVSGAVNLLACLGYFLWLQHSHKQ